MRYFTGLTLLILAIACNDPSHRLQEADTAGSDAAQAGGISFPDLGGEDDVREDSGRDIRQSDSPPLSDLNGDVACPEIVDCTGDCTIVNHRVGCPECVCSEPVLCSERAYCDCRESDACFPVVNGPVCGLDCECEGRLCACASGLFVGCVPDTCADVSCGSGGGECELYIGLDGCPECGCDEEPSHCSEIETYCDCAALSSCRPLVNGTDCGWTCECDPDVDCDCGGTEFLACQPGHCPAGFDDYCDVESGMCELVLGRDGCPECLCMGIDYVCEDQSYCGCLLTESCEVVSDDCICPCDYECVGFESCVCDCGGGEYLGCRAGD